MPCGSYGSVPVEEENKDGDDLMGGDSSADVDVGASERWIQLFVFSCVSCTNGFLFTSIASVTSVAEIYYNTTVGDINFIGQSVYIGYILALPAMSIVYSRYGMKVCLWCAAVGDALGAAFRCSTNVHVVIFGTFLSGVGLPFFLGMPARLSSAWFPLEQRGTATATAALANQAGLAIGFLVPPLALGPKGEGFPAFHAVVTVVNFLVLILVLALFKTEPKTKTPADDTPAAEKRSFWQQVTDWKLMLVTFVFACTTAVYWTLALVLNETLTETFTTEEIGMFGTVMMAMGVPAMLIAGWFLDRFHNYKAFTVFCLVMSTVLLIIFAIVVYEAQNNDALLMLSCGLIGLVLPASQPALLELAVEYTYPMDEAASGSILFVATMVLAVLLTFLVDALEGEIWAAYVIFVLMYCACIVVFACCASTDYKRLASQRLLTGGSRSSPDSTGQSYDRTSDYGGSPPMASSPSSPPSSPVASEVTLLANRAPALC
jgi:MFS family permease